MVKTTIYLEAETALTLRRIAATEKRSQAEVIRAAIRRYTQRAALPKPPGMGEFRSGRGDVSEKAEAVLRKAAREKRWR